MTTILIDANNIGIASNFANDKLNDPYGRPSGAIYGFVRTIRPILKRIQDETGTNKVTINALWDSSKATNWRKQILPSYKASRDEDEVPELMQRYFDQKPRIQDILKIMGVNQLRAEHYEADDIAGHLSRIDTQIVLVSNDRDWLQLVSDKCHVWQPMKEYVDDNGNKQKGRYVTPENFEQVTGCTDVEEFVKMKAIMGDKGDDVPGASGVGEKTAIQYLRGELSPTTKAGKPAKKYVAVDEWMKDPDGYDRSLKLVDLRDIDIPPGNWTLTDGKYDQSAMVEQFTYLGFNSILQKITDWIMPFRKSFS